MVLLDFAGSGKTQRFVPAITSITTYFANTAHHPDLSMAPCQRHKPGAQIAPVGYFVCSARSRDS
jgi:hypothetical protein